jgi:hypothetical protein
MVCLSIFFIGNDVCLHSMNCCFDSGVTCDTHILSPVTMQLKKSLPCPLYHVRKVNTLACRFILLSSVSIFGTQREHNFWKQSLWDTILWRSDHEICGKGMESDKMVNLLFHCMHQIFINHRQSAAPQIIMHIFASFIKVSHPSPYHWITDGMFSIHLTKLTMNVSRFPVSCIQETDYRAHFSCGGLFSSLEHCKHTGRCINAVWLSANGVRALPKDPQTLHACAPSWPQRCSGNICKQNLFCGYAW